MSYYRTEDFARVIEAKSRFEYLSAYEIELAARRMRAEAFAGFARQVGRAIKAFFAARPAPTVVTSYRLSPQEQARLAQAEAIAETIVGLARAVAKLAAWIAAPIKAWRAQIKTRDELEALDDRTLADIGLSRSDIPRVASGLWMPENRTAQTRWSVPASVSNLNKPQIAA